jgi:hypothetical protein
MRPAWILSLTALALAGCEQARTPTVEPTGSPDLLEPSEVPAADTAAAKDIPQAMQGRWGLVAADCTSTKGDAEGLLEIDANALRFYESRGTLGEVDQRSDDTITAEFAFEGEGQTWSRDMTLSVKDDGKTLIRRESGEGAADGPLEYTRCT